MTGIDPDNGSAVETDIATARADLPRVTVGAGAVWVANAPTGTITRVDATTGRLAGGLQLGQP